MKERWTTQDEAEEKPEMQAMQVDEALEHADEWIKGVTLYEGAQGWRVACATLAAEVRKLRASLREHAAIDRDAARYRWLRDTAYHATAGPNA